MDIKEIEKALIKRYRNKLYNKFIKAIIDYELLKDGDVVGVCISGGKDSLTMAKLFQEYIKHSKVKITAKYIMMNPGFKDEVLKEIVSNANKLEIPLTIKESDFFRVVKNHGEGSPCYLCARMRRGFLYEFAQSLGCNKIALGHHYNDVIETTLLNVFYGGTFKTMLPKSKAENFENMELIRPMYYIEEKHIKNFMVYAEINTSDCGCEISQSITSSKRQEIKDLIAKIKKSHKDIEKSIFQSANNVNMNQILGWTAKEDKKTFLDEY